MYHLYDCVHYSSSKYVAFLYEIVHLKINLLIADVIIQVTIQNLVKNMNKEDWTTKRVSNLWILLACKTNFMKT